MVASAFAQEVSDYRIGSSDLLEIRVVEIPDLNVERRVEGSGAIDLPMVGQFIVAGLTALEARAQLEDLLRTKYVNRATVSIVVKEFANRPISVVGAVAKPGSLNVSAKLSLLQAISLAGGLNPGASKRIYVLRSVENGLSDVLEVHRDDLLGDNNAMWNVPIYPQDVINIPARSNIKVFCLGEVKSPGAIELDSDDRISLLTVIAKAGGLTDRASKMIRIKRKTDDGKDSDMRVNYKSILAGKTADPVLKPGDVVIVEESFF